MRINQKQKKFVKIFSSKFFLFCLILVFAGLTKITAEKYIEVQKAKAILEKERRKTEEGEKKNKELEQMLNYFKSEEYIENIAKKKLNLVRPGEKVIYVMPEEEEEIEKEKAQKNKEKSLWDKIREFFKKEGKE